MRAFLGVRLLTPAVKYLLKNPINKIYTLRRQTSQHSTVYALFTTWAAVLYQHIQTRAEGESCIADTTRTRIL